jgi:peptidoglycan-N-acetylglucosamine deacetylase
MKHKINVLFLAVSVGLICLFFFETPYFIPLLVTVGLLFLIIMSLGVLFMKFNYFLHSVNRIQNDFVLLTFDDGPDPEKTPKVLDILAKHNIKAIFFMIGNKAEQQPELIRRVVAEGHLIGNHSYAHNNFMSLFSKKNLKADIEKNQMVLEELTGRKIPFFRPPIGYTNPTYAKVLKEMRLTNVGWTVRSYDSVYKEPNKLIERLLSKIAPGSIVLLHDNLQVTVDALDHFIAKATANGIKFANGETIKTIQHA